MNKYMWKLAATSPGNRIEDHNVVIDIPATIFSHFSHGPPVTVKNGIMVFYQHNVAFNPADFVDVQCTIYNYHGHDYSGPTGKTVTRPTHLSSAAKSGSPQIIGFEGGGGSGEGGDSGGGEESGGDGGGDDDPPNLVALGDDDQPSKLTSILIWLLCLLPDLVIWMRRFEDVFPDSIHDKYYAPGKLRLLRSITQSRDCEWWQPWPVRAWKWTWRWVRFLYLLFRCYRRWLIEIGLRFDDGGDE